VDGLFISENSARADALMVPRRGRNLVSRHARRNLNARCANAGEITSSRPSAFQLFSPTFKQDLLMNRRYQIRVDSDQSANGRARRACIALTGHFVEVLGEYEGTNARCKCASDFGVASRRKGATRVKSIRTGVR